MNTPNLLRAYIKNLILEMSMEDVETSTDPTDWLSAAYQSPEEWSSKDPFDAMLKAARQFGLTMIGEGSSRLVFEYNGNVIKIARDIKGIEQNKLEIFAGKDPVVDKLLAGVEDYAEDYFWLIAKKVVPLSDSEIARAEKIVGVPWNEVRKVLGLRAGRGYEATFVPDKGKESTKSGPESSGDNCLKGQEFLKAIAEFTTRYEDMLPGDLAKLSSWGIAPNGCLVLLDYGITKKKFKELYK